ncbi:hypothetical protein ACQEVB_10730 [Pseudonocardia sp. CA-107938]|uniref:hypothetical protein n=1 Tax=Pseudonocardia sp. CA-107938 TaxID=3240021 RepID=UPI003D91C3B9
MAEQRWVLAYEHDDVRSSVPVGMKIEVGASLTVGRHGDVPLGVEIEDRGISREAAHVTATEQGWHVEIGNRNLAMLHPWGQGPSLADPTLDLTWPRVAIRLLNGSPADGTDPRRHWLLLEADMLDPTPAGARRAADSATSTHRPPRPGKLAPGQLAALQVVFAEHLRWPPVSRAEPRTLTAAGRALGITESGVQDRLDGAVKRAVALGLHRPLGSTNPEYLYVLVRAGYFPPPQRELHRILLG